MQCEVFYVVVKLSTKLCVFCMNFVAELANALWAIYLLALGRFTICSICCHGTAFFVLFCFFAANCSYDSINFMSLYRQ